MPESDFEYTVFKGTGLPNSCGLIAAAAHKWLSLREVKAKILLINYASTDEREEGHSIVIFESGGSPHLFVYDYDGCARFSDININWKTEPKKIAEVWATSAGITKTVEQGKWI